MEVRRAKIHQGSQAKLSIKRQCQLLGVNRSTVYYRSVKPEDRDVDLMNQIREIWEAQPFYGYRRIREALKQRGERVNAKRVRRLMKVMGIEAIYPKPKTSVPAASAVKYPYLLEDLLITEANQVWCVDISYLKLGKGFMYLVALIDVYSRYIVGWSLSNTLETSFCLEALEQGLSQGVPAIVNSDMGCQFTSHGWIEALEGRGILVSMDGKGRCLDNIYIERFWRSVKYEEVYLKSYESVGELKSAIEAYIEFYNHQRPHQSLGYQTPGQRYWRDEEVLVSPSGSLTNIKQQNDGLKHSHQLA